MKTFVLSFVAALAITSAASAQHTDHSGHAAQAAAPATVEGVGVVKAVNPKAGTITLAHDPIKALNWPAMTMPFKVSDKALVEKAAVGSKIRFQLSGQTIVGVRAF